MWQGYTVGRFYSEATGTGRNEGDLWQQVLLTHKLHKLDLLAWSILEERFIEDTVGHVGIRFRQQVRGQYPISADKQWSAVVYDEYFANLNSLPSINKAGYDQNRVFVGINKKITPHVNMEAGYMLNTVNRFNKADQFNHIIMVQLNYRK